MKQQYCHYTAIDALHWVKHILSDCLSSTLSGHPPYTMIVQNILWTVKFSVFLMPGTRYFLTQELFKSWKL